MRLKAQDQVTERIMQLYYDKVPRFKIEGMNQAEFLGHIIAMAFNAGQASQFNTEEGMCECKWQILCENCGKHIKRI